MRITQNQIVNKAVILETAKQDQAKNLVGKTIEGLVTAVNGNKITLSQNGQLLNLINDSATVFQTDQKVQLLVTGFTDGALTATPLAQNASEDAPLQMLERFGVVSDTSNREIAEAMIKYDVPMTQDNFNTMKQNLAAAKAFLNDIQMAPDKAALIDVEKTLKENVLNFMKLDQQALASSADKGDLVKMQTDQMSLNEKVIPSGASEESALPSEKVMVQSESVIVQSSAQLDQEKLVMVKSSAMSSLPENAGLQENEQVLPNGARIQAVTSDVLESEKLVPPEKEVLSSTLSNSEQISSAEGSQTNIVKALMRDLVSVVFDKPSEAFHEVAEKLVSLFNLEEDAIFTKNNLDLNLKNLFVLNQLKFTEKSVGNGFFELSKIIGNSKLSKEDLLMLQEILNEGLNDKFDENEKLLKVAQFIKERTEDASTKEKIDKEVLFIKDASQMTKQLNEPLFYMQIPIKMDAYERSVDLYYRRKKNSDDKDDFTILIALKTNHYDEVRCIIEKKKDQYVLNFKLANEEIKDLFESKSLALENQLAGRSYILKFTTQEVSDEKMMETPKQSMIDIKV